MNYRLLALMVCAGSASVAVAADSMPHYKPGLWAMTMSMGPKAEQKVCIDEATEKEMYRFGVSTAKSLCGQMHSHISSSGSVYTSESVCKQGSSTRTSHSVMTFSGDTAYHTEITSHVDPPTPGQAERTTTMDGKWMGACPADMKPGDMVVSVPGMEQPIKMNIKEMAGK